MTSEVELTKQFYRKGVKKFCRKCGYYVYLCPDVEHHCSICGTSMQKVKAEK